MTRKHLLTLIDVVSDTAALLECLPVQPTDALTDAVHRYSCDLRKVEKALMLEAAARLLDTANAPEMPSGASVGEG